jgi:hypothetical protein
MLAFWEDQGGVLETTSKFLAGSRERSKREECCYLWFSHLVARRKEVAGARVSRVEIRLTGRH